MSRTMIALPCMDTMPVEFVKSLLYLRKGEGTDVCFHDNSLVYDSRNLLSLTAIDNKYDYVMWLDSDMVFKPDTLDILRHDLDTHTDIGMVTGVYMKRRTPILPVMYSRLEPPKKGDDGRMHKQIDDYVDYPRKQLFPIAGCGFGCVLVRTLLLKEVWDAFGVAFNPFPWAGEDISFCHRVNQLAKHQIWCDSNVQCGHVGKKIFFDERGE